MRKLLFIIGAGRSGTNLLAHALSQDDRVVNAVENRYIWNFAQNNKSTDYRAVEQATDRVKAYIRRSYFSMFDGGGEVIVDKTPGNGLRLEFVSEVFPEAFFINLLRDGRANVFSRARLWDINNGNSSGRGVLEKFYRMYQRGNLPADRVLPFISDQFSLRMKSALLNERHISGERVPSARLALKTYGPLEARAVQWSEAVMAATIDGRRLENRRYIELKIEEVASKPSNSIIAISDTVGFDFSKKCTDFLSENVNLDRLSSWKKDSGTDYLKKIERVIRPTNEFLRYPYYE